MASLKIAGLAAGAALAGPLAGRSVTGCLLAAAGTELCAAGAYLLAGPRRRVPETTPPETTPPETTPPGIAPPGMARAEEAARAAPRSE